MEYSWGVILGDSLTFTIYGTLDVSKNKALYPSCFPTLRSYLVGQQQLKSLVRDVLPYQIVCFFLTLFKRPLTPPSSFLNIYVADYIADYSAK